MSKKRISKSTKIKNLQKLKSIKPLIIFKVDKLIVTLSNQQQLSRWLSKYPEGTYTINS
jgi:hypothetical protein